MLLPMIILAEKFGDRSEKHHLKTRFMIRDIEFRLKAYSHSLTTHTQGKHTMDLNTINTDLAYGYAQV
jgi:hypothetical protein